MLLAQQKLSMLKALEESSLQASILPSIVPAAIADFDDEDDDRAHAPHASASAADSTSPEFIHLKFMSKTKQQVGLLRYLRCILRPITDNPGRSRAHLFDFRWSWRWSPRNLCFRITQRSHRNSGLQLSKSCVKAGQSKGDFLNELIV
jgi:hypothetical protein